MSYIAQTLQAGEVVHHYVQLHWWIFVRPVILLLVGLLFFTQYFEPICLLLSLVFFGFGLYKLIAAWLEARFAEFVVTNKRVVFKRGLIRREVLELQLHKAEALVFRETLWGDFLALARLWLRRAEPRVCSITSLPPCCSEKR